MFDRLLRRENQAQHVEVEHLVKMLGRHVFERLKFVNAGVVNKDVDLPESFPDTMKLRRRWPASVPNGK